MKKQTITILTYKRIHGEINKDQQSISINK